MSLVIYKLHRLLHASGNSHRINVSYSITLLLVVLMILNLVSRKLKYLYACKLLLNTPLFLFCSYFETNLNFRSEIGWTFISERLQYLY